MKVGIVVPFSWSFWGAVVEHAELQAAALQRLGIETRTIIGNDPPGTFTRSLHPRDARARALPARRHVARLRRPQLDAAGAAELGLPRRADRPPDRGLECGARV